MKLNSIIKSSVNDIKDCLTSLKEKSLSKNYKHSIRQCNFSLIKSK